MTDSASNESREILHHDLPQTRSWSWRFFQKIFPPFRRLGDNYTALLGVARALDEEHTDTKQKVLAQSETINSLTSDLKEINGKHETLLGSYQTLQQKEGQLSKQCGKLEEEIQERLGAIDSLQSCHDITLHEKKDLELEKERLLVEKSELAGEKDHIQGEKERLAAENEELLVLKGDLEDRYHLVSSAISARGDATPKYQALSAILEKEFLPFANSINVLKSEAEAIIRMRGLVDQLRVIESMSRFMDKTVVALSGGFSSGKSSFINSMLSGDTMKLPVGLEPMTAIPTYVGHGEETRILGYSTNGGVVEIPAHLYSRLSHAYVESFSFNLRDLLPYVAVETPLRDLENISFIDLPGYDPGASESHTASDSTAASEFLEQAHALIWVIGLDSNGTIPRSDIEFLEDHADRMKRLYIVINKADLRPASDLARVLEEVRDILELSGIAYEGISAYSSVRSKEYDYSGSSLTDALGKWNSQHNSLAEIANEIDAVFALYYQAFDTEIEHRKTMHAHTHALELDLLEIGAFNEEASDIAFSDILKRYGGRSVERTVTSWENDGNKDISEENRARKIDSIKTYIKELKVAYSVESIAEQKAFAASIHKRMLSAL
jgi:GTP-binding protein EngB required for normal cell division